MDARLTRDMSPAEILATLRQVDGYYLCNNERDVSQSDFKNRLMPMTSVRVAPYREAAGFFSAEVTGGASVHVDLMRRQVNPFERLRIIRKAMPRTLLQTVVRGPRSSATATIRRTSSARWSRSLPVMWTPGGSTISSTTCPI